MKLYFLKKENFGWPLALWRPPTALMMAFMYSRAPKFVWGTIKPIVNCPKDPLLGTEYWSPGFVEPQQFTCNMKNVPDINTALEKHFIFPRALWTLVIEPDVNIQIKFKASHFDNCSIISVIHWASVNRFEYLVVDFQVIIDVQERSCVCVACNLFPVIKPRLPDELKVFQICRGYGGSFLNICRLGT